ncbi:MAG: adenine nucleotide alpha hydrolase [Myxococcales bacterium]|nr:adenine nucleotide alpha hydrolase [Myxococcales bacterium]
MTRRALLSWSSGKDSAWALHRLRERDDLELIGLVTTVNEVAGRVAMHAVREALLAEQARAIGLPVWRVPIPSPCSNAEYAAAMTQLVTRARDEGVEVMAFGDLFLEDIRAYRVGQLEGSGIEPIFPVWGEDTARLAREMVEAGLRAHVTCVDPQQLSPRFVGRTFDGAFLDELPDGVDPCGERGEFHTFAWAGPMFSAPIPVVPGPVVERDGFHFADLLPGSAS